MNKNQVVESEKSDGKILNKNFNVNVEIIEDNITMMELLRAVQNTWDCAGLPVQGEEQI